jgi:hypothetical protein
MLLENKEPVELDYRQAVISFKSFLLVLYWEIQSWPYQWKLKLQTSNNWAICMSHTKDMLNTHANSLKLLFETMYIPGDLPTPFYFFKIRMCSSFLFFFCVK